MARVPSRTRPTSSVLKGGQPKAGFTPEASVKPFLFVRLTAVISFRWKSFGVNGAVYTGSVLNTSLRP